MSCSGSLEENINLSHFHLAVNVVLCLQKRGPLVAWPPKDVQAYCNYWGMSTNYVYIQGKVCGSKMCPKN